jgi:hypothetical protein
MAGDYYQMVHGFLFIILLFNFVNYAVLLLGIT